jgi:hypothetical protein
MLKSARKLAPAGKGHGVERSPALTEGNASLSRDKSSAIPGQYDRGSTLRIKLTYGYVRI